MSEPLVIITSKVHEPRMRAHKILLEHGYQNWLMVVDNVEQRQRAFDLGVPQVVTAHTPDSIPRQDRIAWVREFIEREIVPRGAWYVSLDDNVGGWTWLPWPLNTHAKFDFEYDWPQMFDKGIDPAAHWRNVYDTPCPFPNVVQCWQELIDACEAAGTLAGGFAIETNYFFRGRKWQTHGYVRAQNAVWKNTGLPFYYWHGAMLEDFIRSVDVVVRTGQVLINRYVKPQKQFFEAGGIGTFEERRPNLVACSQELLKRYPGLLRPNKGQDYQLTFALRSKASVERWRDSQLYRKVDV